MTNDPRPGSERAAATFGGPGWAGREGTHATDVAEGRLWRRAGCRSETAPLQEVMLAWPPASIADALPPDDFLFLDRVDLKEIRRQAEAVAAFFQSRGIVVHWLRAPDDASPNLLFQRDLYLITVEGAFMARMAARQRAGEERLAAAALAGLGVPILQSPRGAAVFEGADALWLNSSTVLVGTGRRTNAEGFAQLSGALAAMGVQTLSLKLPEGVQHLLGILNPIDADLAAVDPERSPAALRPLLERHGIRALALPPGEELSERRSLNFVTLGPRELVMPANCPGARVSLEAAGVRCHELDVSEYIKAAGGLGCLTGILRRSD